MRRRRRISLQAKGGATAGAQARRHRFAPYFSQTGLLLVGNVGMPTIRQPYEKALSHIHHVVWPAQRSFL
jgi:hypothetical protein